MLRTTGVLVTLTLGLAACQKSIYEVRSSDPSTSSDGLGTGGPEEFLTLPFPSGEYWNVTQKYNTGSHVDYGFTYGDDRWAIDFSQSGCEAYGKPVTPMASGQVYRVYHDGDGDHGYGNSVLVNHGNGFVSRYAHFSEITVTEGEFVDEYDIIGMVGNTGYVNGTACSEHPGTHLHVALYEDLEGIVPEPLSGAYLEVGCWYNREGDESCSGDPGEYEPEDEENHDEDDGFSVRMLEVSPEYGGVEDETNFIWATVVNSPEEKPEVDLVIYNERDNYSYHFEMETKSKESPYIYTYEKTLRDSGDYSYWIEASVSGEMDRSGVKDMEVESSGSVPQFYDFDYSPTVGLADDTEFNWHVSVWSEDRPALVLNVVNPLDAQVYSFSMDVSGADHVYMGEYEKTLNDEATYTFWVTGESDGGNSSSHVGSIEVD